MRSADVEGRFVVLRPAHPTPFVAACRANQHPVHVEENTFRVDLGRERGGGWRAGKRGVHGARVSVIGNSVVLNLRPKRRLLCRNPRPVQLLDALFPLLDQLRGLLLSPLGAGKHPLRMGALAR